MTAFSCLISARRVSYKSQLHFMWLIFPWLFITFTINKWLNQCHFDMSLLCDRIAIPHTSPSSRNFNHGLLFQDTDLFVLSHMPCWTSLPDATTLKFSDAICHPIVTLHDPHGNTMYFYFMHPFFPGFKELPCSSSSPTTHLVGIIRIIFSISSWTCNQRNSYPDFFLYFFLSLSGYVSVYLV